MTPSASASPIVLLSSPAAPVAAPAATAGNAPTPALDGGFQLLIDTATQQQLAAQLAAGGAQLPAPAEPGDGAAETDVGNVLPLTGLLLPVDGEQAPVDGETKKEASAKEEVDADAAAAATIPLPWVPVNIQAPPQPAAAGAAPAAGKSDQGDRAIGAVASATGGGVQLTAPAANAGASTAAATAADAAVDPLAIPSTRDGIQLGAGNPAPPATDGERRAAPQDGIAKPASELLTTAPADDGSAALADSGARKGNDAASFADLLKPATNTQSQAGAAPAATVGAVDTGRTHQVTRSYLDVGGNAATATVSVPVGSSGWSDAVVDKVMWFSANQLSSAEIKLNPPDLGPLQVRISTQHDQTSVVFSSPHAAVRDALDQALPRLRDMFGGQGLQLTDASVGGQAQRQQQEQQGNGGAQQNGNFWFGSEDNGDTPVAVTRVVGPRLATSAVDAYA